MKYLKLLPFLLAIFILVVPAPQPRASAWATSTASVPKVIQDARPAVFNLQINNESICTAFAVNTPIGKELVSAGHCAEGIKPTDVVVAFHYHTNHKYKVVLKSKGYHWPDQDYSVWTFLGTQPPVGLNTTHELPVLGDDVYAVIGTRGMVPFLTNGIYAGIFQYSDHEDEKNGMHIITAPGASNGASGSPVFDSQGRVWGILVGGNPYYPGISLIVPLP